jgi:hypothetical protein
MALSLDYTQTTINTFQQTISYRGLGQSSSDSSGTQKQSGQSTSTDKVYISKEALSKSGSPVGNLQKDTNAKTTSTSSTTTTSPEETRQVDYLKNRDREVRAHEQAHVIAGGSLVRGAASFGYTKGPDGKLYATSGEVSIDTSPVQDDPEATIRKMIHVEKAALAPSQPSGQDRAVASSALKTQMEAQYQVAQEQRTASQKEKSSSQSKRISIKA